MRKLAPILAAASCVAVAPAVAGQPADVVARTVDAGLLCVLSADKKGAAQTRFDGVQAWTKSADGASFTYQSMPIVVTFPKDSDGIARICEVRATLPSQTDQAALKTALETSLKRKPFEQSNSVIWMLDTKIGPRGLQFFPDKNSTQPAVRLVGAAF